MQIIEDLDVYKVAYDTVLRIYKVTESIPTVEKFGLVSQMRRAAVSIISNMSEGGARNGDKEQNLFLGYARGSVAELRCQARLAKDLEFISLESFKEIDANLERVKQMLTKLLK